MANVINYMSNAAIPVIITVIILYGLKEKKKVFDIFLDGGKEGLEIVIKMFPTLIGIFLAVGALRSSGIIDLIVSVITPITNLLEIPSQIMPLALLRPISGSASMAVAVDIMQNYGVDTLTGLITSTIMGSTETTLYTVSVYTRGKNYKNIGRVITVALIGDILGILLSVKLWNIMS